MNILRKIQYSQYWNIGFCEQTQEELIRDKHLKKVKWLQHPFKDRWFADPFIYKVTNSEIVVFVEECPMENPKGIITELVIDRKTICLKERFVLLELDTHLSYPAIIKSEGKAYVYPENGASGNLYIYEYDELNHSLINPKCIIDEALADATILEKDKHYYMSATKYPNTQESAYLFESKSLFGPFIQTSKKPFQTSRSCSRQGGLFFEANGNIYRPAQDCKERYGASLSIMETNLMNDSPVEIETVHLFPQKGRFCLGLHTLNFLDGLAVLDGYGYYMPVLGKLYYHPWLRSILRK